MAQEIFFVDKTTDTFADVLATFGLAFVLAEILGRVNGNSAVRLEDGGGAFLLRCTPPLEQAQLDQAARLPDGNILPIFGAPVIRTEKNAASLPADLPPGPAKVVDYEVQRDHNNTYWEAWKQLPQEARSAQAKGEDHPALLGFPGRVVDWDIYRALNPAGLIGYNALMVQWWKSQQALPDLLRLLWQMTATSPNDVAGAQTAWRQLADGNDLPGKAGATASQIFNPSQGKGQNRPKANHLSMENVKNFWLLEWLKAVGFYQAAITKQVRGSKDRKTYVLVPHGITLSEHRQIMPRFRGKMLFSETPTRFDIVTAIRYMVALLQYCQQNTSSDLFDLLTGGHSPDEVVSGFHVAFYKNLGQSPAVMNLAFINLPAWVKPRSGPEVAEYLELLDEHETIIRQLDESHSDAFHLLQHYRDFVTGNSLDCFFRFTTAYSGYLISQKERGRFAPQFTVQNLRRLIMNTEPQMSDILDPQAHPGFARIAYAIRQSTVIAQWRKQQGDRRYDVRYGLGQELARKSRYGDEFITALSDFLHKYNAENAQIMEKRSGPYRRSIQTVDIDDIVALVDEFGSQLICNLLVAYGYARSPREAQSQESETSAPDHELDSLDSGGDTAPNETQ